MSVIVRQADLVSDRERLIDALFRYLTPRSNVPRFDWLYCKNPYGQARAWIALDAATETVIGMAAAFPRRFYTNAAEIVGWVLGDFCVSTRYRSLGPALQLQRACLAAVETEGVAFCYDLPNPGMLAVYRRLGVSATCQILRLARPLRIDRKIHERVRLPLVAHVLSRFGNALLSFYNRRGPADHSLTMALHEGSCGDEFSDLTHRIGGRQGVCIARSAEYLNWRYVDSPLCRYELVTARRHGALLGYAVFMAEGEDALLVDLFGTGEEAVLDALVMHVVTLLSTRNIQTLSAPLIESHPWRTRFEWLGFKPRETSPMVLYTPTSLREEYGMIGKQAWLFMHGDRDS